MGLRIFGGARIILLPLFGILLGAAGAFIYEPTWMGAMIVAIGWEVFGLSPHEDAPGVRRWIIAAASIAARAILLTNIPVPHLIVIFVAAQTVSRVAMIIIAWVSRPDAGGAGHDFLMKLSTAPSLIAIAIGAACALWCGLRPAAMIVVGAYIIIRAVRWFAYRYASGANADALGATQLLTELFVLAMFTCSACRW